MYMFGGILISIIELPVWDQILLAAAVAAHRGSVDREADMVVGEKKNRGYIHCKAICYQYPHLNSWQKYLHHLIYYVDQDHIETT